MLASVCFIVGEAGSTAFLSPYVWEMLHNKIKGLWPDLSIRYEILRRKKSGGNGRRSGATYLPGENTGITQVTKHGPSMPDL